MPGFPDFAGVVEITHLNTSKFLYYLEELHSDKLVFAFSFVSSNNTDVETTDQFILLHTRYVCDFSGLTNFSQKLWISKKTFISYFVYFFSFLAFDPRWIFWCLSRKEVSPWDCLLISKVSYRTVYLEKLFPWLCNTRKETTILKNALSVIRLEHNLRLYYKHVLHRATAHVWTKLSSGPTLHYPLPNKVRG